MHRCNAFECLSICYFDMNVYFDCLFETPVSMQIIMNCAITKETIRIPMLFALVVVCLFCIMCF